METVTGFEDGLVAQLTQGALPALRIVNLAGNRAMADSSARVELLQQLVLGHGRCRHRLIVIQVL